MKRISLRAAVAALWLGGLLTAGAAYADEPPPPWQNPHYPDMTHGSCAGGNGGGFGVGYCDGEHYPDGSYWHQTYSWNTYGGTLSFDQPECVVDPDGGPLPQPAPPGGCDGNA